MASEVISTALLLIASVIACVALINAIYPSLYTATSSITSMTNTVNDRMKSEVRFIYSTGDTSSGNTIDVWVKNIGSNRIFLSQAGNIDIFYGRDTGVMTHTSYTNGTLGQDTWQYTIENDAGDIGVLDPGETLHITIRTTDAFIAPTDQYRVRLVLANGVYCEDSFSV
jgi:archaeal flagellar protein FlaG